MIFLYFISGETSDSVRGSAAFKDSPLPRVFFDCADSLSRVNVRTGPDGSSGVVLAAFPKTREKPFKITYSEDSQEWQECEGFWIGRSLEHPPSPEGLERSLILDGYSYSLADGRFWNCPRIRRAKSPMIPSVMKRHRGLFEMTPEPDYAEVWEASGEWSRRTALDPESAFLACRLCLNLNYRVWDEELSLLSLINQQAAADVIAAALDEQFFIDVLSDPVKKKSLMEAMEELPD